MTFGVTLGAVWWFWAVFLEVTWLLAVKALDVFSCCLLFFTPSPLTVFNTLCSGVLGTACGAAGAGMKGWAEGLICVLRGNYCLGCQVGDACGVTQGCVNCS